MSIIPNVPRFVTRHIGNNVEWIKNQIKLIKSGSISHSLSLVPKVSPNRVFCNHNLDMGLINAFGFDYDHTLANYKSNVDKMIYDNTVEYLCQVLGYPKQLYKTEYDSSLVIRGLNFDKKTGNLMKLNEFYKIGTRTIYNGYDPVSLEDIHEQYNGLRINANYFDQYFHALTDLFCIPKGCLYVNVIETLRSLNIPFEPQYIFDDINKGIDIQHSSPNGFHKAISKNPEKYINKPEKFDLLFKQIKDQNRKLFLITNNSFQNVNNGMAFLFENIVKDFGLKNWTQVFDIVITEAKKPSWFSSSRKFREYEMETNTIKFAPIMNKKNNNNIYVGGCLAEFERLTGITSENVLYFGDSIGSDLSGPYKVCQWKTCAILRELNDEINLNNDLNFRKVLTELLEIDHLLQDSQLIVSNSTGNEQIEGQKLLDELRTLRSIARTNTKEVYNARFGSVFRTHSTRTLFFHEMAKYSDIYCGEITYMCDYAPNHLFNCRRLFYDHEPNYWYIESQ